MKALWLHLVGDDGVVEVGGRVDGGKNLTQTVGLQASTSTVRMDMI